MLPEARGTGWPSQQHGSQNVAIQEAGPHPVRSSAPQLIWDTISTEKFGLYSGN